MAARAARHRSCPLSAIASAASHSANDSAGRAPKYDESARAATSATSPGQDVISWLWATTAKAAIATIAPGSTRRSRDGARVRGLEGFHEHASAVRRGWRQAEQPGDGRRDVEQARRAEVGMRNGRAGEHQGDR